MISDSDWVLDIECANWTTFVVGALTPVDDNQLLDEFVSPDPDRLADAVLSQCRGRTVWAHYGGHYDWLWLLSILHRRGIKFVAAMAGTSPVAITVGDGADKIILRDSYRLWPQSLASLGKLIGCEKGKPPLECQCGLACGGYCSIRPEHAMLLTPYLLQDCRVLRRVLQWIANLSAKHSIPLKTTVGATAWADARDMLGLPAARECLSLQQSIRIRQGYYGGRVEVYRMRASAVWEHDVHSMYPWALSSGTVPIGKPRQSKDALSGPNGIVWCTLTIPEMDLPPLPMRDDGSLAYCHGQISGAWPACEIHNAIEHGAVLEKVHSGYSWKDGCDFRPWLQSRANLRAQYGYQSAESQWLKWLVNSLTGKFAQRPVRTEILPYKPPCKCGNYRCNCRVALEPTATWWAQHTEFVPSSGHIGAAATLTGRARVELYKQLMTAGEDRVYCDTDSVYSMVPLTRRLGDAVGQWGREGPLVEWEAAAPKVYRVGTKAKCKGARMVSPESWEAFVRGEGVRREGVRGLSGAVRRGEGLFVADAGVRVFRGGARALVGSRARPQGTETATRSLAVAEYQALKYRR